ncbi:MULTISPECIES: MotE family protein [Acetobacteraceae]|uniref:MotE family protein n=2 Tax=Acetobacterales TaxID=3120395 RepID=UPI0012B86E5D|nr:MULTISPECIES: hypothetical protein [Acetobacteraceae]MCL1512165.1 hypothetical protein [Parasaccharibacter sp. TMW 2.1884]MPV99701.1 hypothetical protein [Bombella apis]
MLRRCFHQHDGWFAVFLSLVLFCGVQVGCPAAVAEDVAMPDEGMAQQMQEQQRILGSARKALEMRFHLLNQSMAVLSDHVDNHKLVPQEAAARLVGIYEAMRPREAAAVFNVMDPHVLIAIAASMNIRKLSGIMAHMSPDRVNLVSQYLGGVRHFHHAVLSVPVALGGSGVVLPTGQDDVPTDTSVEHLHYETMSQHGPLLPSRQ